MNKSGSNIENLPTVSPLLNEEIMQKDYSDGIGTQEDISQGTQASTESSEPDVKLGAGEKKIEDYKIDPDAAKMKDDTKEFVFDQTRSDGSGGGTEDGTQGYSEDDAPISDGSNTPSTDSFKLPEASAKEFAETIVNIFSVYVPQFCYAYVKVDPNNIQFHIEEGNLKPEFKSVFNECNRNSESELKFSPEELDMLQNSLQKYLEYKNVSYANPETAFWGTVAVLTTKQVMVMNKLMKSNQKLVYDAIQSSNPDFRVKQEEKKEKPKTETETIKEE